MPFKINRNIAPAVKALFDLYHGKPIADETLNDFKSDLGVILETYNLTIEFDVVWFGTDLDIISNNTVAIWVLKGLEHEINRYIKYPKSYGKSGGYSI